MMGNVMRECFSRTAMLFGEDGVEKLCNSRIAVFGVGGVGSYAVEALVRSGIGEIDLIDSDRVAESNINRQLIATSKTVGEFKVDVAKKRAEEINPLIKVNTYPVFFMPENADDFDFSKYDYVIDAIDTVTAKLELICRAVSADVKIISCMGAGNKLDPTRFEVADIYKTSVCPLARVMRAELRKRGVNSLKVVYSKEEPAVSLSAVGDGDNPHGRRSVPASNAFVPATAGLIVAGEVVKDIVYGK